MLPQTLRFIGSYSIRHIQDYRREHVYIYCCRLNLPCLNPGSSQVAKPEFSVVVVGSKHMQPESLLCASKDLAAAVAVRYLSLPSQSGIKS